MKLVRFLLATRRFGRMMFCLFAANAATAAGASGDVSYAEFCRVVRAAAAASPNSFDSVKGTWHNGFWETTIRRYSAYDDFHCFVNPPDGNQKVTILRCVVYVPLPQINAWTADCLKGWKRDPDNDGSILFSNHSTGILLEKYRGEDSVTTVAVGTFS